MLLWRLYCIGEEPVELLAEACAINSFDIDRHNPSVSGWQLILFALLL